MVGGWNRGKNNSGGDIPPSGVVGGYRDERHATRICSLIGIYATASATPATHIETAANKAYQQGDKRDDQEYLC
jgi:hypothetical protein